MSITLVQVATPTTGISNTASISFSSPTTQGNFLAVIVVCGAQGIFATQPTLAWFSSAASEQDNFNCQILFYRPDAPVTTTVSSTIGTVVQWVMFGVEVSGLPSTGGFSHLAAAAPGNTGTGNLVETTSPLLLLGSVASDNAASAPLTPVSWNILSQAAIGSGSTTATVAAMLYLITSSPGTYNGKTSGSAYGCASSFKAARDPIVITGVPSTSTVGTIAFPVKYSYVASGGITMGGTSGSGSDPSYVASGGITMGGSATTSAIVEVDFDIDFSWNVLVRVDVDQEFQWNFGAPVLYFYQVTSDCASTTCDRFIVDNGGNCNSRYITFVLAPNVSNVCQQLTDRGLSGKVVAISKFSRAAFKSDQAALMAQGIDQSCNQMVDQDFCILPPCAEFCVDYDVDVYIGAYASTNVSYVASGGITMGGSAGDATVSMLSFGGGSPTVSMLSSTISLPDAEVYTGAYAAITYSQVDLNTDRNIDQSTDPSVPAIPVPNTTVRTQCDCKSIPLVIFLRHNLSGTGNLQDFLVRNGISLPQDVVLSYNSGTQSWQSNIHLRGIASDGIAIETWNMVFVWQCTSNVGGTDVGSPVWSFGMYFNNSNEGTGEDADTRVLLSFPSDGPCQAGSLAFGFDLDTQTQLVSADPNIAVYGVLIYDSIGMFRSLSWQLDPVLNVTLYVEGDFTMTTRLPYDPTPIFTED